MNWWYTMSPFVREIFSEHYKINSRCNWSDILKTIINIFVFSQTERKIFFCLTCWKKFTLIRPSSAHLNLKFKIGHISSPSYPSVFWLVSSFPPGFVASHSVSFCVGYIKCTLISRRMVSHKTYTNIKNLLKPWVIFPDITVRLIFVTNSVRMRPNFHWQPWFEFDGLVEDEWLIRFCWIDKLQKLLWFYFQLLGAN